MPTLELLVGNIGSGKSTYASLRAKQGWAVVNGDSIVTMIHGGNYELYKPEWNHVYKMTEQIAISSALGSGINVVVDRTSLTRKIRRYYIGLGHSLKAHVRLIVFPFESPELHSQRRFRSNSRGLSHDKWLSIAQDMKEKYEIPQNEEGYDEIVFIEEWKGRLEESTQIKELLGK